MALTSPDAIRSPNDADQYALVQDLGVLADSTQVAITRRANMYLGTSAQRIAFTTAPDGAHWQDTNGTRREYVRTAGAWLGVTPISGTIAFGASSGTTLRQTVTFPAGYFAVPPAVHCTVITSAPGSYETFSVTAATIVTAASADILFARPSATPATVNWTAIPSS